MKPSWYATPRTLDHCTFRSSDDPIEHHKGSGYGGVWWFIVTVLAAGGAALVWVTR